MAIQFRGSIAKGLLAAKLSAASLFLLTKN